MTDETVHKGNGDVKCRHQCSGVRDASMWAAIPAISHLFAALACAMLFGCAQPERAPEPALRRPHRHRLFRHPWRRRCLATLR